MTGLSNRFPSLHVRTKFAGVGRKLPPDVKTSGSPKAKPTEGFKNGVLTSRIVHALLFAFE
jgi:hypothetical protein